MTDRKVPQAKSSTILTRRICLYTDAALAGAAPLRHALRALASEPGFLRALHDAIARQRTQVYAVHRRLAQDFKSGGSLDERLRGWTRLADGAVIGLSYLARLSVDAEVRSAVAPFAVLAVGEYGARRCDPDSVFELQYVLPEDQKSWERSGRIVASIRIGLTELGLAHYRDAVGTAVACACVARGDPVAAARFATARFLSGRCGLYTGFVGLLVEPRSAAGSTPTRSNRSPSDINAGGIKPREERSHDLEKR